MILPRTNNCKFIFDMTPRMQSRNKFGSHFRVKSYRTNNNDLFYYFTLGRYRTWWTSKGKTFSKKIWF